jgi:hypothetical protein
MLTLKDKVDRVILHLQELQREAEDKRDNEDSDESPAYERWDAIAGALAEAGNALETDDDVQAFINEE